MAYQSLYRRYRPQRFGEVRGQDHLVRALQNAVAQDRVGHAYLLTGPRGTGKTSTARILAKALNCDNLTDGDPCGTCESCLAIEAGRSFDLQELDAASNSGVSEMRALLETIALGNPGHRKVYILDEVHMLSKAASAALLKTLEEPPAHVVFVLATTDLQKVLPTIRSRTQQFDLHLLPSDELRSLVDDIAADAGLELSSDQIEYALRKGGGSARDTLSAVDQVAAAGLAPESIDALDRLLDGLVEGDPGIALSAVQDAVTTGREPRVIGEQLLEQLRDAFLLTMKVDLPQVSDDARVRAAALGERMGPRAITRSLEIIGEALVEMRQAADPRIPLDVALLRITRPEVDGSLAGLIDRVDRLERQLAAGGVVSAPPAESGAPAPRAAPPAPRAPSPATPAPPADTIAAPSGGRPADAARNVLASMPAAERATGSAPPPVSTPPSGTRPALGAHRSRAAAAAESPATEPAPAAVAEPPSAEPSPAAPAAVAAGPLPSRDEITLAWGESILGELTQRTRSRWSAGRFIEVTDGAAVYGLPNQVTCDRCGEGRPEVEAVLAKRFGVAVPVRLVVDGSSTPPQDALDPATMVRGPDPVDERGEQPDEAADVGPVHELEDAGNPATGFDKLTEAFPGAELVDAPLDDRP